MSSTDRDPRHPRESELPELERPLAELVEERARGLDAHPAPEQVRAYAAGELSAVAAEEMREHLSICGDCLDSLLLRPDVRVAEEDSRAVDFETFRAWREMRARIREHELRKELARRQRSTRWLQVAAALLVLAPALMWMQNRRDVSQSHAPAVNAAIYDVKQSHVRGLEIDPSTPRASPAPAPAPYEGATPITVPEGIEAFTLVFWLDAPDFDAYEIVVRDHDGEEIWRSRDLRVDLGTATLGLSRRFLQAGRYRFAIYGMDDDGRKQIGDYSISLSYS